MDNKKVLSDKVLISLFFVIILWILLPFFTKIMFSIEFNNSGLIGDTYGIINSLFSGLALCAVYATYSQQQINNEDQSKYINLQSTENTFFNLLNLYNRIVVDLDIKQKNLQSGFAADFLSTLDRDDKYHDGLIKGRDVFVEIYKYFYNKVFNERRKLINFHKDFELDSVINNIFTIVYDEFKSDLSHYYLTLYNIVKFIDNSKIDNKQFYVNILRAQLSSHELLMLYYDSKSKYGEKFLPLIKKYNLLKHIPSTELIENMHDK